MASLSPSFAHLTADDNIILVMGFQEMHLHYSLTKTTGYGLV